MFVLCNNLQQIIHCNTDNCCNSRAPSTSNDEGQGYIPRSDSTYNFNTSSSSKYAVTSPQLDYYPPGHEHFQHLLYAIFQTDLAGFNRQVRVFGWFIRRTDAGKFLYFPFPGSFI